MKKTIAIIEDNEVLCEALRNTLESEDYNVICWNKYFEAGKGLENLFNSPDDSENVIAIIFDYILDINQTSRTSIPLISFARRRKFKGIMLANSSENFFMEIQMKAGCTHQREEGFKKQEASGYLLKILREQV